MPSQISVLIQREVPIGTKVGLTLDSGLTISGTLIEIGTEHIALERDGQRTIVPATKIACFNPVREEIISQVSTPPPSSTEPDDVQLVKRLLEIEAQFKAQIDTATPEILEPDFAFPESDFDEKTRPYAKSIWDRIRNKYEYAKKINELGSQFGRITPIITDLQRLVSLGPDSGTIKRHLAFFLFLAKRPQEALAAYQEAALRTGKPGDWHNMAVLAWHGGMNALACYGWVQLFKQKSITDYPKAWYALLGLIQKDARYPILGEIAQSKEHILDQEGTLLSETCIYLLKVVGKEQQALQQIKGYQEAVPSPQTIIQALETLDGQVGDDYVSLSTELAAQIRKFRRNEVKESQLRGYVWSYDKSRGFGFLRGADAEKYFFHCSAVSDENLMKEILSLKPGTEIPVFFSIAQGPKGPLAIEVSPQLTVEELLERAIQYANEGEYDKAIVQVRKVLVKVPDHPQAQEYYNRWREYARALGVPKGSNPYARAKRAQLIEKNLDRAAQLFQVAIRQGDNVESAIKDLAAVLAQQGRSQEAIKVLQKYRDRIRDQRSVDNLLIGFYQNAGQYEQAIDLLRRKLDQSIDDLKKAQIWWQIAFCYLKSENYVQAEHAFRSVFKLQPENTPAERNIAFCLFKRGDLDEAQTILERILRRSPDIQTANLLEAVKQAQGGRSFQVEDPIIGDFRLPFTHEISGFTQHFLKHCSFEGVPPDRIRSGKFSRGDIQKLEELASRLGTRRPRERAGYYLSAASIVSQLEDEDPNLFYRFLFRSFVSRGDAVVVESGPLDSAREFYCEALRIYDGDRNKDEQDQQYASEVLVKFLRSILGAARIPISSHVYSIEKALQETLSSHPEKNVVFDAIAYLISYSNFASRQILGCLFERSTFQAMALEYLKYKGIAVPGPTEQFDEFCKLWREISYCLIDDYRTVLNELRVLTKTELNVASLEDGIRHLRMLTERPLFDLDRQRLRDLQGILATALDLCKQTTFEEQERLCNLIETRCQDLEKEIERNPTRLSIEGVLPVIEELRRRATAYLEILYEKSAPQLTLKLPVESYSPDDRHQVNVQIAVSNRVGCSPAEKMEVIVVQEQGEGFTLCRHDLKIEGSLRGGDQRILVLPLRVSPEILRSQTFSLPLYAQYQTRSGEIKQTSVQSFSIRLYSEDEFEEIENPYAPYAEGGIVSDPNMFYGRDELIANIAKAIQSARTQSKSITIFGQKRAGKSSILHHLKMRLQQDNTLLVLDVGNVGSIFDAHSPVPFMYQFLWSILHRLKYVLEDRPDMAAAVGVNWFPSDLQFYQHPSPLALFREVFERVRHELGRATGQNVRPVLLVDEFSYIYGYILSGRIPEDFMKLWKGLLQENHFSAVLVGQDVMPKFKQRFPNEFGITQDERVTYLKHEDARRLIDEPIRIGGRHGESRYRERAVERIIDLTAGSPFYIQIICNRLVEYMNRKRAYLVTEADVEQVKEDLVRGVNALTLDKFDNLLDSGDTSSDAISSADALKVLTQIALHSRIGPCARHDIVCDTDAPIDTILDDLVKRDVVDRERGQYYSIRVGLFREWLLAHQ